MSTLTWPLRVAPNGSLAAVEQDTVEDIESRITAILSYPLGWRDDNPAFGRPKITFRQGGVDVTELAHAIGENLGLDVEPDIVAGALENGIQDVTVNAGVASV